MIVAPFSKLCAAALAAEIAVYAAACIAASIPLARSLPWKSFAILPIVMATYHIAYGLGFIAGLLRPARRTGQAGSPAAVFTELTR